MDITNALSLLQHHVALTRRLVRRVGHGDAEDLASEAVARGLRRPAPDGRQAPWIEKILRNLVIDRERRLRRAATGMQSLETNRCPTVASPEDLLVARERRAAVLDALPRLPPHLRDAIVARYFEEHDYHGIAASRGISAATARTRVHRALAQLRASLARLRALVPAPILFGPHAAAFLPAVLTATLIIQPVGSGRGGAGTPATAHAVLVAQSTPAGTKNKASAAAPSTSMPVVLAPAPMAPTRSLSFPVASSVRGGATGPISSTVAGAEAAVQHFRYDDDEVAGDLKRPGIDVVTGDPGSARHGSLIEIPRSFEPALTKMLEDL